MQPAVQATGNVHYLRPQPRAEVLQAAAEHLLAALRLLEGHVAAPAPQPAAERSTPRREVQFHARDSSVFVDGQYLIKGVAGALLWKFLNEYVSRGRTDFCYRELRLDAALRLPDVTDNLGARLGLLEERLAERVPELRIVRKARGLIGLAVACELSLSAI